MTLDDMDNLEIQSDLFRNIYEGIKAADLKMCKDAIEEDGYKLTPLTHHDYMEMTRERIRKME
jgi:hypothetical protein